MNQKVGEIKEKLKRSLKENDEKSPRKSVNNLMFLDLIILVMTKVGVLPNDILLSNIDTT